MKATLPMTCARRILGVLTVYCLLASTSSALAQAGGVMIRKPYSGSTDRNSFRAEEYGSLNVVAGNVLSIRMPDEELPKRMSTATVADYMDYPEPRMFDQITTDEDVERVRRARKEMQDMLRKWPQASSILRPRIATFNDMLSKYDQGMIKSGANWIQRDSLVSFTLENGNVVKATSAEGNNLELTAETDLGVRRYSFFELSKDTRAEFFPEFTAKVEAAEGGDPDAMKEVAMSLYNANRGETSMVFAQRLFERLAEEGDETARYRLGLMKQNGIGIEQYLPRAQEYYQQGAQNGFEPAGLSYGLAHYYGFDGEADYAAALEQFEKLAASGSADAKYLQAMLLAHGLGVEESKANEEKAVGILQELVEKEHPWALYDMALAYERGAVVKKDLEQATALTQLAASLGNPLAENALGYQMMMDDMEGNASLAAKLFKSAADEGYAGAMQNMGVMNHYGVGMSVNFDAAESYYRNAQAGGIPEAEGMLKRLASDRERANRQPPRMGSRTLYRESDPSWRSKVEESLNHRVTLFRRVLEEPWLPGGDPTNVLAEIESRQQAAPVEPEPDGAAGTEGDKEGEAAEG